MNYSEMNSLDSESEIVYKTLSLRAISTTSNVELRAGMANRMALVLTERGPIIQHGAELRKTPGGRVGGMRALPTVTFL